MVLVTDFPWDDGPAAEFRCGVLIINFTMRKELLAELLKWHKFTMDPQNHPGAFGPKPTALDTNNLAVSRNK